MSHCRHPAYQMMSHCFAPASLTSANRRLLLICQENNTETKRNTEFPGRRWCYWTNTQAPPSHGPILNFHLFRKNQLSMNSTRFLFPTTEEHYLNIWGLTAVYKWWELLIKRRVWSLSSSASTFSRPVPGCNLAAFQEVRPRLSLLHISISPQETQENWRRESASQIVYMRQCFITRPYGRQRKSRPALLWYTCSLKSAFSVSWCSISDLLSSWHSCKRSPSGPGDMVAGPEGSSPLSVSISLFHSSVYFSFNSDFSVSSCIIHVPVL